MKIAMVVPFEEEVPPRRYGGIELVVANLIDELAALGHSVTLLGTGNSEVPAKVIPIFKTAIRQLPDAADELTREAYTYLGIARVLNKLSTLDVDIIHNHLGWQFLIFRHQVAQPVITTIHLSLEDRRQRLLYGANDTSPLVSISLAQRKPAPDLHYIENVYNGIKVDRFTFRDKPGTYLAFLGSVVPHKGLDTAISVARKVGKQLVIGAKIDPLQQRYFDSEIKPHIDNKQIVYLGELDHSQKNELLSHAEALLMPVRWDEPFGLVVAEALACGTPVLALRRGAMSELIEDGKTGFLCDSADELMKHVKDIPSLSRQACREAAMTRFNAKRMTKEYLGLYEKVVRQNGQR